MCHIILISSNLSYLFNLNLNLLVGYQSDLKDFNYNDYRILHSKNLCSIEQIFHFHFSNSLYLLVKSNPLLSKNNRRVNL